VLSVSEGGVVMAGRPASEPERERLAAARGPVVLAALASASGWTLGLPVALVWAAHIGLDRALGYGLKLPTGFHDTHLGAFGRGLPDAGDGLGGGHVRR